MPSGSHSGSSSSHSSGGSSFGGGSHSSHSSSSGSSHYGGGYYGRGPRTRGGVVIFAGSGGSVVGGAISLVVVLVFFSIIFAVLNGVFNSNINKIKEDYAYYQAMIDHAKTDPENLIVKADVEDYFYDYGKYQITYSVKYDDNKTLEGYTYFVYSLEEAMNIYNNKKVDLAIMSAPITKDTDSITMDFDGRSFKDDGEYINVRRSKRLTNAFLSVFAAIFVSATAFGLAKAIKDSKKEKEQEGKQTDSESKTQKAENESFVCPYCGSKLRSNAVKCPNCGSSVKGK